MLQTAKTRHHVEVEEQERPSHFTPEQWLLCRVLLQAHDDLLAKKPSYDEQMEGNRKQRLRDWKTACNRWERDRQDAARFIFDREREQGEWDFEWMCWICQVDPDVVRARWALKWAEQEKEGE